jgi:DnaJ family protein C protein 7
MAEEAPLWEIKKEQGNAAFRNNLFEEAIERYTEAIEDNSSVPLLYSNRSAAYLKKSMFQDAMRDAEKAIASDPLFVKAYPRLHTALCNQGKFTDASRSMAKGLEALRAAPSTAAEDLNHLHHLEKQALQIQRSLEDAKRAISEGNHQAAERLLIEPARAFPECPTINFMFAEARVARAPDEVNRSLASFSRTHDSDPHYLYVRALANYYRGQDGFKNTLQLLRSVLELDPDYTAAQTLLRKIRAMESAKESGNASFRLKNYKEAIDFYTAAIDVDGSNKRMNSILRGNRAAARLEAKEYQAALLDCDFAISNGNETAKMFARRSRIHEAMDKWDDAIRDLERAAEQDAEAYQQELHNAKVRAKRAKKKDYYKILEIANNADDSTLKKAYRNKCLQWHPDKWAHSTDEEKTIAEAKFKEVGEAFSLLSDPRKRQMYDSGQIDSEADSQSGGMGGGGASQEDMMRMFNMMFQGGGDPFGGGRSSGGRRRQQAGVPPGFSFSFQ